MRYINELKYIIEQLSQKGGISQEDVNSIFLRIRQIFENDRRLQNRYPLVNLFCNWVIHTKLKDSITIYRFLFEISKSISTSINLPNGEDPQEATRQFITLASNVLQIPKLRKMIKEIFQSSGIDTFLTDKKEWWDAFVALLLKEISDKPLEFPPKVVEGKRGRKKATEFFKELQKLPHIYDWDKIIKLLVFDDKGLYCLKLYSISRAQYVVQISGREEENVFT